MSIYTKFLQNDWAYYMYKMVVNQSISINCQNGLKLETGIGKDVFDHFGYSLQWDKVINRFVVEDKRMTRLKLKCFTKPQPVQSYK